MNRRENDASLQALREARDRRARALSSRKRLTCLKCKRGFLSVGSQNRLCVTCLRTLSKEGPSFA